MTRWCTRLAALIGSTMALVCIAAAAASARPIGEHVGSAAVSDGGAPALPSQPVDMVQSGAPITGWIVATVVLVLMAAGVVLVVRTVHAHHAPAV
jgi:hypothetical protein